MAINFPASPTDGQTYTENGVKWKYNSAYTAWLVVDTPILANTTSGQILYNDEDTLKSSSGLSFSAASNTLHVNAVSVAGNITIGSTDVQGVVSSAFSKANTACTNADTAQTIGVAAFSKANTANLLAYNTGIGANAFASATISGANTISIAAFNKANAALPNTSGVSFAGDLYFPTGNVGIGTTSPVVRFHVDPSDTDIIGWFGPGYNGGTPYNTGNKRLSVFSWSGSSGISLAAHNVGGYLIENSGADLTFKSGYNGYIGEKVRLTSAGNVGIGTSTPSYRLNIQSVEASELNRDFVIRAGDQTNYYRNSLVYNASASAIGPFPSQSGGLYWEHGGGYGTSGGFVIATNNTDAGPLIFGTNNTERIRLTSDGNVGIGTSSPSYKLDVNGSLRSGYILFGSNQSVPTADAAIIRPADGTLALVTSSAERMRITSAGNVGIGRSDPSFKLDIYGGGIRSIDVGGGGYPEFIARGHPAINIGELGTLTNHDQTFITNSSEKMRLTSAGNLGIGTGSPSYKLDINGTGYASSNFRAPIFYDSNNTGYYLDPASTSVLNAVAMTNMKPLPEVWHTSNDGTNRFYFATSGRTYYGSGSGYEWRSAADANIGILDNGGTFYNYASVRSPIFYDSDNTGYYLDPASTSLSLNAAGSIYGSFLRSTNASGYLEIGPLNTTYAHYMTDRGYHYFNTHLSVNGNIYDYSDTNYYLKPSSISFMNDLRPTVIYDRNDTNYYLDPNGTSSINVLYANVIYDRNDSNYYLDPNNISYLNDIRPNIVYDRNDTSFFLDLNNSSYLKRVRIGPYAGSSTTGNVTGLEMMNNGGTGDSNLAAISFHCSGTYGMHLHLRADGYFGAGGWSASAWRWYINMGNGDMTAAGNVVAYSDPRLKEDIVRIESPIEKVKELNGVKFKWKDTSIIGHPGEYDYGILSTDVEKVLPELVIDSLHESPDGDMYKTVAYDKLSALLIEAIKEQQTQIELMKEEIQSLKGVK